MTQHGILSASLSSVISGPTVNAIWEKVDVLLDQHAKVYESWDTKHSLHQKTLTGQIQLWVTGENSLEFPNDPEYWDIRTVAFTTLKTYPSGLKEMYVMYLMGEDLMGVFPDWWKVEEFARIQGCDQITTDTRPGISKLMMKEHEFTHSKMKITKILQRSIH